MKNSRLDILNRRRKILEYLKTTPYADVNSLASYLETSPATIRRDIIDMETDGSILKYHGSIRLADYFPQSVPFETYSKKSFA